ncbi:MAG: bifunctional DNA-formamidopyrimidine glycosylase/DNA-(apurinic or apyrimidinic site) lyase [Patescibacteria group bacterium]
MPELPEVETIRRQLEQAVVNRRINRVEVFFSGRLNLSAKDFSSGIEGRKILSVRRRAKILLINMSGGYSLVVHLKMSGQLLLVLPDHSPGKHTHIVLHLSGRQVLFFDDVRKFGYFRLFKTAELSAKVFAPAQLGVEPLEDEFTVAGFTTCLRHHSRAAIKPLLLSQKCVVGVGNIYSDESLWTAKIRPNRPAGKISAAEIKRLHSAIRNILAKSIEIGGTSFDQYRDTAGKRGGYVRLLKAYGRDGLPCARCGEPIKKTRLGGRGTHWCPKCQK